uniref:Transmembrane protein n=1 Tax=Chrysotila carterae TaxID=13221 RepID=A0A7S4BIM3_CHRCT
MGGSVSHFPTSTSSLVVLPLKQEDGVFCLSPMPLPASIAPRMSENEFNAVLDGVNKSVVHMTKFSFFSLLTPFLLLDALTMLMLICIDPLIVIAPWELDLNDVLFPLALEFGLIVCGFPLMLYLVNSRMELVQIAVRAFLDEISRGYASRGLNFQLKEGVVGNGAATNMWVEVQVAPVMQVQVPVPVPTLYPLLMPGATPTEQRKQPAGSCADALRSRSSATGTNGKSAQPAATSASASASASATLQSSASCSAAPSSSAAAAPHSGSCACSADSQAAACEGACESGGDGGQSLADRARASAAAGSVTPEQLEYLRALQENQMLRQYLQQYQTLLRLQAEHAQSVQSHTQASAATPAASAVAPATSATGAA